MNRAMLLRGRRQRVVGLTYGSAGFSDTIGRLRREAAASGFFDDFRVFGYQDIPADLVKHWGKLLHDGPGAGWWLWKPVFVRHVLRSLRAGDTAVWVDAGCTVNSRGSMSRYLEHARTFGFAGVELPHHLERDWTAEKTFAYFGVPESSAIRDTGQRVATYFFVRSSAEGLAVADRFFDVAHRAPHQFVGLPVLDRSKDTHRHDQSVLSLILKQAGIPSIGPVDNCSADNVSEDYPLLSTRIRPPGKDWPRSDIGLQSPPEVAS